MRPCDDCGSTLRWITMRDGNTLPMNPVADPTGIIAAKRDRTGRYTDGHHIATDADRKALKAAGYTVFRLHSTDPGCKRARR